VTFHVLVDGEGGIDMPLDHTGIISTHAWDIIFCSFKVVVWPPLTPKIAHISVDIFSITMTKVRQWCLRPAPIFSTHRFSQLLGEVVLYTSEDFGKVSHVESHRVDFKKLRCWHHCHAFVTVMEKM
jgi:hypothetical protein